MLEDEHARDMCMRFAEMETRLGEVDRARAVYGHCSQMSDPRVTNFNLTTIATEEILKSPQDCLCATL